MSRVIRWCAALAVALLAACSGIAPRSPDAALAPAFELAGRVSVRYQGRVFSSALRWKQNPQGDEIWLTAPLGQTLAYLQADADSATITTADHKQYRANSVASLTRSALGWSFPVDNLRYWAMGQTVPGTALSGLEKDSSNRITRFRQDDFLVTFSYADPEAARPLRMDVAGGDTEIRLIIDNLTNP